MKNGLRPFAKSVLISIRLTAAASTGIHWKILGPGNSGSETALVIPNKC